MKTVLFDKVVEWKGPEKEKLFPGLPSSSRMPNPILAGDTVIVSSFMTKALFAIHKSNGKVVWRYNLGIYGGPSPSHMGQAIIAGTFAGVLSVSVKSGRKNWIYEPYGRKSEWFYSDAVATRKRVFIADRFGYLHCLDIETGKLKWKTLLSKNEAHSINATVLVVGRRIYAISTGGELTCVDSAKGRIVWSLKLPDGSIRQPIISGSNLYIKSNTSVSIVNLKSRKYKICKFKNIADITVKGNNLFVIEASGVADNSKHKLKVYSSGKVRTLADLKNMPNGFVEMNFPSYLAIAGYYGLIFFNLKKSVSEIRISGEFSTAPLIEKNLIYTISLANEVVCLRHQISSGNTR